MTLAARIVRTLGSFELDVELAASDGEVVALLGPNGAGKSTVFRCLAGLLAIDAGRIELDGEILDDPAADVFVAPEQRRVGVVFQDYSLFANLSALENVAFGLRARRMPRAAARACAREWLERFGLADHADHRPGALSGGQAQRVALARTLATAPRLLLLDEPLAALDAARRGEVRRDLRHHLCGAGGTRLVVTHDPVDAYALADRVVIIESGRVVQTGALADVAAHPRTRYVADLVGVNLVTGTIDDGAIVTTGGGRIVPADHLDGPAVAVIQPHAVALYLAQPAGSPRNVWQVTVADIDRHGDRIRVRLEGAVPLVAEITSAALEALALRPGTNAWASVKATEITTYPV